VSEERGAGFGSFLLGLGIGAVVGFLFAPEGEATRGKLGRHLRGLRDLAAEKAEELGDLLQGGDDEADTPSARAALEQRLTEAKRRRRGTKALPARAARGTEEDEPVA
jgi:gas vesicle protein